MASKSESTLDQIRNEVEGVRTANEGIGSKIFQPCFQNYNEIFF